MYSGISLDFMVSKWDCNRCSSSKNGFSMGFDWDLVGCHHQCGFGGISPSKRGHGGI
jgi:hypothetical protein